MFRAAGVAADAAQDKVAVAEPKLMCKALGGRVLCRVEGHDIVVSALPSGEQLQRLVGHSGAVTCLDLDVGEGVLVTGSVDGTVRKWDLLSYSTLAICEGHPQMVTSVAICERLGALLSGCADGCIRKWDFATGALLATLEGHRLIVTCLACHEEEGILLSGSGDRTVRKWDIATCEPLQTLVGHDLPVTGVTVDPGQGMLYSGEFGGHLVRVWDLRSGELLETQKGAPQGLRLEI